MKELRKLGLHIVLLCAAAIFAYIESRPEDAADRPLAPGEVELWGGSKADVASVTYVGKRKTVSIVAQKDDTGTWYKGTVTPSAEQPADADAGADAGPPPKPEEAAIFAAVSVAEKLVEGLAPMRAKRAIGEVGDDRAEAFGLHAPEGELSIDVGDKKHTFTIGAATMGSGDRYVRYHKDNLVYVIDAAVVRDLEGGAGRLAERQQHAWKMADVERASVVAGEHSRELVRSGTEGRRFWADAKTVDVNDETAANWLKKLERLRPVKFAEAMPEGATKVVRVDFGAKDKLGWLELHRAAGADGKQEYWVLSEYLRMPSTVAATVGEQVQDDLNSVFGLTEDKKEDTPENGGEEAPDEEPINPHAPPDDPHGDPHGDPH